MLGAALSESPSVQSDSQDNNDSCNGNLHGGSMNILQDIYYTHEYFKLNFPANNQNEENCKKRSAEEMSNEYPQKKQKSLSDIRVDVNSNNCSKLEGKRSTNCTSEDKVAAEYPNSIKANAKYDLNLNFIKQCKIALGYAYKIPKSNQMIQLLMWKVYIRAIGCNLDESIDSVDFIFNQKHFSNNKVTVSESPYEVIKAAPPKTQVNVVLNFRNGALNKCIKLSHVLTVGENASSAPGDSNEWSTGCESEHCFSHYDLPPQLISPAHGQLDDNKDLLLSNEPDVYENFKMEGSILEEKKPFISTNLNEPRETEGGDIKKSVDDSVDHTSDSKHIDNGIKENIEQTTASKVFNTISKPKVSLSIASSIINSGNNVFVAQVRSNGVNKCLPQKPQIRVRRIDDLSDITNSTKTCGDNSGMQNYVVTSKSDKSISRCNSEIKVKSINLMNTLSISSFKVSNSDTNAIVSSSDASQVNEKVTNVPDNLSNILSTVQSNASMPINLKVVTPQQNKKQSVSHMANTTPDEANSVDSQTLYFPVISNGGIIKVPLINVSSSKSSSEVLSSKVVTSRNPSPVLRVTSPQTTTASVTTCHASSSSISNFNLSNASKSPPSAVYVPTSKELQMGKFPNLPVGTRIKIDPKLLASLLKKNGSSQNSKVENPCIRQTVKAESLMNGSLKSCKLVGTNGFQNKSNIPVILSNLKNKLPNDGLYPVSSKSKSLSSSCSAIPLQINIKSNASSADTLKKGVTQLITNKTPEIAIINSSCALPHRIPVSKSKTENISSCNPPGTIRINMVSHPSSNPTPINRITLPRNVSVKPVKISPVTGNGAVQSNITSSTNVRPTLLRNVQSNAPAICMPNTRPVVINGRKFYTVGSIEKVTNSNKTSVNNDRTFIINGEEYTLSNNSSNKSSLKKVPATIQPPVIKKLPSHDLPKAAVHDVPKPTNGYCNNNTVGSPIKINSNFTSNDTADNDVEICLQDFPENVEQLSKYKRFKLQARQESKLLQNIPVLKEASQSKTPSELIRLWVRALPLTLPSSFCSSFGDLNESRVRHRSHLYSLIPSALPDILQTRVILRQPKVTREQFLQWPLAIQRAAEFKRARSVVRYLNECCSVHRQPWTVVEVVAWARHNGYTPVAYRQSINTDNFTPEFHLQEMAGSSKDELPYSLAMLRSFNTDEFTVKSEETSLDCIYKEDKFDPLAADPTTSCAFTHKWSWNDIFNQRSSSSKNSSVITLDDQCGYARAVAASLGHSLGRSELLLSALPSPQHLPFYQQNGSSSTKDLRKENSAVYADTAGILLYKAMELFLDDLLRCSLSSAWSAWSDQDTGPSNCNSPSNTDKSKLYANINNRMQGCSRTDVTCGVKSRAKFLRRRGIVPSSVADVYSSSEDKQDGNCATENKKQCKQSNIASPSSTANKRNSCNNSSVNNLGINNYKRKTQVQEDEDQQLDELKALPSNGPVVELTPKDVHDAVSSSRPQFGVLCSFAGTPRRSHRISNNVVSNKNAL